MANVEILYVSRFRGLPETLDKSEKGIERVIAWHTEIELLIAPVLRLEPTQQEVICHDYGMNNGNLNILCKAALLQYVLQAFKLDPYEQEARPEVSGRLLSVTIKKQSAGFNFHSYLRALRRQQFMVHTTKFLFMLFTKELGFYNAFKSCT